LEQLAGIPTVPTSLDAALDALEADHAFLTKGRVFTDDLIATYVEFRREQSDRVKIRPYPYEFPMYFDG
jgi:glutamine synthetase